MYEPIEQRQKELLQATNDLLCTPLSAVPASFSDTDEQNNGQVFPLNSLDYKSRDRFQKLFSKLKNFLYS